MRNRSLIVVTLASGLCACSSMRVPTIDLYGTALPRWTMLGAGLEKTSAPTTPYALSPVELSTIKLEFSNAFKDGRTLQFGPVSASRRSSGSLVVCGLVSIHKPDGRHSGMTLFDGVGRFETPGGRLAFTPKRLAGGNASAVDVYSACRDAGAL